MKQKIIGLLLALVLCATASLAEAPDLTKLTDAELWALQGQVEAELWARTQAKLNGEPTPYADFNYVDNGSEVMIRGYNGTATELVIPSEINGMPVTKIGNHAFYENKTLKSVVIPDSVIDIGEWAFASCEALTTVSLPNGITELKDRAFSWCNKLTTINLDNITTFGDGAMNRTAIKGTITLKGEHIVLDSECFRYCSFTGIRLICKSAEVGMYALTENKALKSIYISDGAEVEWNYKACTYCGELEVAVFPMITTFSGSGAENLFNNCTKLTIYTPEGSGMHTKAKELFIKCNTADYAAMSAQMSGIDAAE